VVHETDDRSDSELAEPPEPLVRPRPIGVIEAVRCRPLPEDGEPQGRDPEAGETVEVVEPPAEAG
jgi:hypothetical protein